MVVTNMRIFIFSDNIFSVFVRLFKVNVAKVRILLTYFSMPILCFLVRLVKFFGVKDDLLSISSVIDVA